MVNEVVIVILACWVHCRYYICKHLNYGIYMKKLHS